MGYTVKGPQKCSVCCIQCPWKSVCDGSVSRAAAQVTELSMDAAQSCGLKVVSEHCCAAFDKQLNLSQQQHRMYKHLQNRNYSNTWYLDYPFTIAKRDVLWPLLKSIHTIMQYTSFEYSWKKKKTQEISGQTDELWPLHTRIHITETDSEKLQQTFYWWWEHLLSFH